MIIWERSHRHAIHRSSLSISIIFICHLRPCPRLWRASFQQDELRWKNARKMPLQEEALASRTPICVSCCSSKQSLSSIMVRPLLASAQSLRLLHLPVDDTYRLHSDAFDEDNAFSIFLFFFLLMRWLLLLMFCWRGWWRRRRWWWWCCLLSTDTAYSRAS